MQTYGFDSLPTLRGPSSVTAGNYSSRLRTVSRMRRFIILAIVEQTSTIARLFPSSFGQGCTNSHRDETSPSLPKSCMPSRPAISITLTSLSIDIQSLQTRICIDFLITCVPPTPLLWFLFLNRTHRHMCRPGSIRPTRAYSSRSQQAVFAHSGDDPLRTP